jgi:non-canonical poly(A) RNA polymerase PAPD5/7
LQAEETSDKPAPKFAALDTLSDSEEAEMDFSDDSDEEARPRKRRALGSDGQTDSSVLLLPPTPTPKWSNPDPYTVLPPPDETQHKRVDVVKLIRKARLANAAPSKQNDAVVDNQDFISLGMVDPSSGAGSKESEDSENKAPDNAPKGPRGMEIKGNATKRTRDEQQPKGYSPKLGKPQRRYNSDASILHDWRPMPGQNPSPWLVDTVPHLNPASRYVFQPLILLETIMVNEVKIDCITK